MLSGAFRKIRCGRTGSEAGREVGSGRDRSLLRSPLTPGRGRRGFYSSGGSAADGPQAGAEGGGERRGEVVRFVHSYDPLFPRDGGAVVFIHPGEVRPTGRRRGRRC